MTERGVEDTHPALAEPASGSAYSGLTMCSSLARRTRPGPRIFVADPSAALNVSPAGADRSTSQRP